MLLNQVYLDVENAVRYRIVFEDGKDLMLIDIDDPNAWPISLSEDVLLNVNFEQIEDPYPPPSVEKDSVSAQRRDAALDAIAPLLANHPLLFDKRERNRQIKARLKSTSRSRLYITRNLRRYWQRGMAPNSLAPDYHRSGARGQPRREVRHKAGPKRKLAPGEGVIINDEIAQIFRTAIELHYIPNQKFPLVKAKDKAVGMYKARYPLATESEVPTRAQFLYFFKTNYLAHEVDRIRMPSKTYDKDVRALQSTAARGNIGPGGRYEIDATIADLYLISVHDPSKIIGRPVIYFVKDVFSRLVVGLYVGLENPSWVSAMIAMANAFTDKVDYCKELGIDIDPSSWPSVGLPESIMADRGELLYRQADVLVNRLGIQLSNSRAYRGDDKGICERHFRTIQAEFRPYVEGIVEPVNGKKRIGRRYELDAELTLPAFQKMITHIVLFYNNQHVIEGYDYAPDMPTDLPAIPLELWNWGIKHRTGRLKACEKELTWVNLLPYEKGTVSNYGITFKGLIYTCQEAIAKGWFDRNGRSRPKSLEVAYDPRRTNQVYLRPDGSYEHFWTCELSDRSRRYKGMSFVDAGGLLKASRSTTATAKQKEAFSAPELQQTIEEIVRQERAKKTNFPLGSASSRLKGIEDNRRREKEIERDKSRAKKCSDSPAPLAEVIPFKDDADRSKGLD
ncbi:MAG: Mu transposase C-terminal domain-containing protein, partial [Motiliproteus sp.]|nr:Mu transposase C-terminal domain-containing protein [Motiliproteus sp.]